MKEFPFTRKNKKILIDVIMSNMGHNELRETARACLELELENDDCFQDYAVDYGYLDDEE